MADESGHKWNKVLILFWGPFGFHPAKPTIAKWDFSTKSPLASIKFAEHGEVWDWQEVDLVLLLGLVSEVR